MLKSFAFLLSMFMLEACVVPMIPSSESPTNRVAQCRFEPWMKYREVQLYRMSQIYGFVTDYKTVDADGAPNAYHPDDVGSPCRSHGKGLDCPQNAGYPDTSWWSSVLVTNPELSTAPYVQPSGPSAGFFVSQTALRDANADVTDPHRYVDASIIPYLVFPRSYYRASGTGKLGDLGFAYNKSTGEHSGFIVGDIGPTNAPLGEASIGLFEVLGGEQVNARTGAGVPSGEIIYFVFPYSVDQRERPWPMTLEAINDHATQLLSANGGLHHLVDCLENSP